MRVVLATIGVLLAGSATLWVGTDGLQAFTSEQARRLAIAQDPRVLPAVTLQDQDGHDFTLDDYRGKLVLIDFIYTRCRSLCMVLGANFQRLFRQLLPHVAEGKVVLLSISFDPQRDTSEALSRYARHFQVNGKTWRFARIDHPSELQAMLEAFGIVVIPDRFGEFQHNAAIHLVNRQGRLARIFDYDVPDKAADYVLGQL